MQLDHDRVVAGPLMKPIDVLRQHSPAGARACSVANAECPAFGKASAISRCRQRYQAHTVAGSRANACGVARSSGTKRSPQSAGAAKRRHAALGGYARARDHGHARRSSKRREQASGMTSSDTTWLPYILRRDGAPPCMLLFSILLPALLIVACGEPPNKELHQAQGAIDAARAAGAAVYAPEELKGAVDALTHAQEAVGQRDYRLALNHALDSREQRASGGEARRRRTGDGAQRRRTAPRRCDRGDLCRHRPIESRGRRSHSRAGHGDAARRDRDRPQGHGRCWQCACQGGLPGARQRLQGISRAVAAAVESVPPPPPPAPPARPTRAPRRPG